MYFALPMKRIIISSIIALVVLLLAATGFYYSQKYTVIHSNPIDAIPSDAAFFIEVKNGANGLAQLKKSELFKLLDSDSSINEIQNSFNWVDSLAKSEDLANKIWSTKNIFISAHPTKATDFDFLYCLNLPRGTSSGNFISLIEDLSEKQYSTSIREYENVKIYEIMKQNESYFTFAISKGVFMFSRTSFLVEDAIRQLKNGISFKKSNSFNQINKVIANDDSILLYVNHNGLNDLLTGFINNERTSLRELINNICRWSRFNLQFKKSALQLEGVSSSSDTLDLFHAIKNQSPLISKAATVASSRTSIFIDICTSNISKCLEGMRSNETFYVAKQKSTKIIDSLNQKLKIDLSKLMTNWNSKEVTLLITEPGSLNLENNTYALMYAEKPEDAVSSLEKIQFASGKNKVSEKYRSHSINHINENALVPLFFGKLFIDIQQTYFTTVRNFIVFGNSPSVLKSFIDDYEDKKTLDQEEDFIRHKTNSQLNGQINLYFNLQKGGNILRSLGNDDISEKLINDGIFRKSIQSVAISFSAKDDLVTSKSRIDFGTKNKKEIRLLWSTQLDTSISSPPFTIKVGNENLLIIQDNKNNLNLYNESGQLIWKKIIDEPILSDIFAIDQYHNGEVQIIFNTPTKLYIIDSKGDSVGKFPIRLPTKATNGCLVKDFDGNNHFQIYVACENGIVYAYESTGKPVDDWIFKQSVFGISKSFSTVRYENNTFLIAQSKNGIILIDRKGKVNRVSTDFDIDKMAIVNSDSGQTATIYLLSNTRDLYSLHLSNLKAISKESIDFEVSDIVTSGNDFEGQLIILSKNQLYKLEGGSQSLLKIFDSTGDYSLVSSTNYPFRLAIIDKLKNRFFLLNKDGSPSSGYPVYGSTRFNYYEGSDISGNSYLVVGSPSGIIYVYTE